MSLRILAATAFAIACTIASYVYLDSRDVRPAPDTLRTPHRG